MNAYFIILAGLACVLMSACHRQAMTSTSVGSRPGADMVAAPDHQEVSNMNDGMPTVSRPPPPKVEPIEYKGVRYEQDMNGHEEQSGGYLLALDATTGKRLWELKVYVIPPSGMPGMATPGVYFTSMKLVPGHDELVIENEIGGTYRIDLHQHTSTWLSGPDAKHE